MSVMLNKEKIQTGDVIYQKYHRVTAETDVIVPDINPDILNILEVSGYVTVTEKSCRNGKIYLRGTAHMTVLYSPEGEVLSKVKHLSASQEFNHAIDVSATDADAVLTAEAEAEGFSYTLINSRKVNLRCTIGLNAKLTALKEYEIAVSADCDGEICTDTCGLRLCNNAVTAENRITICQQLELPSDKPSISEILKTTVFPESAELTLMQDKASAKGQVRVCTLYISADDGSVQTMEHTLPFSEILDAQGAEEDMEGEIDYTLSDLYCEIRDDSDGEPRIIGIDLGLAALVRGIRIQELNVLCDAYSLKGDTKLTEQRIVAEQLMDNTTAQLTHKASISIPEGLPEIARICDLCAVASVDSVTMENGSISLSGCVKCNILYMTAEEGMPLCSFTHSSEFTHTMPSSETGENAICDAKVFTEHISYTMNGGNGVDLRAVLGLSVRSFINRELSHITDIEIEPWDSTVKSPCISVYFVKKGDTLWSIAKKYRTTVDAIKDCNGLTCDKLSAGQQIKICR